ncbi:MAG: CZB domain-containing protein [Deltaproteobacteria bacterium]|nr:CZB domain-containing protein [Deltaproteobacteria bacterium]
MRAEIEVAIEAHSRWKESLTGMLERGALGEGGAFVLARVQADDACSFGRWLFGPTVGAKVRSSVRFERVRELHREFHASAADVLMLAVSGNRVAAEEALERQFRELSQQLVAELRAWGAEVE